MKTFLLVLASLVATTARAADVDVVMREVSLVELTRVYFQEIERADYALDADVLADESLVSIDARRVSAGDVGTLLRQLLTARGYAWDKVGALNVISRAPEAAPPAVQTAIYAPRHREATYLAELLRPFAADATGQPGVARATVTASSVAGSDAVVISGTEANVQRLQSMLQTLDTPAGEVMVRGVVYEVASTESAESAIAAIAKVLNGRVEFRAPGPNLGYSGAIKWGGLEVLASALSRDSRFKLVSSPRLRVRSGATARVQVGTETPVLGNVTVTEGGQLVQSVEYRSSGVILDLQPVVRAGGIDLTVKQQLSEFAQTSTGVDASPTLMKREVSTVLTAQSGELVMLGGLDQVKSSDDWMGLSFLPRWLGTRGRNESSSELLILLEVTRL